MIYAGKTRKKREKFQRIVSEKGRGLPRRSSTFRALPHPYSADFTSLCLCKRLLCHTRPRHYRTQRRPTQPTLNVTLPYQQGLALPTPHITRPRRSIVTPRATRQYITPHHPTQPVPNVTFCIALRDVPSHAPPCLCHALPNPARTRHYSTSTELSHSKTQLSLQRHTLP